MICRDFSDHTYFYVNSWCPDHEYTKFLKNWVLFKPWTSDLAKIHQLLNLSICISGPAKWISKCGAMEHWKVLSATMVDLQENFSNSRRSRMAKAIIFWLWWWPFDSFCFETLSFLPLSPFFLFAMQKSGGKGGEWRGEGRGPGGPWPPRCRRPWFRILYLHSNMYESCDFMCISMTRVLESLTLRGLFLETVI